MAKLLLIDDDPLFGNIMSRFASRRGAEVAYFESLMELESSARLGPYDAAIVDYDLGGMTGIDIAEHLDMLFGEIPMVLISSQERDRSVPKTWPPTIRGFVRKQAGCDAIFSHTMAFLKGAAPSTKELQQASAITA